MSKSMRLSVLPLVILFVILAAFVFVSPVSAQDEVPPEPEVPPAETELVEESAPAEVLPVEALEEIGVVIVDEQGASLPLASELAEELLTGGDPYFKVGTVTHRFMQDCSAYPGDPNCHVSATPIQAAVDFIDSGKIPSDGKIYFDSGTNFTEDVLIDGVAGLKGMIGAVNPMDNLPNVTINGHLWVRNTSSGFTLNGFKISGNEAAPDEDLDLLPDYPLGVLDFTETAGTLILTNLKVTNSNGAGEGIVIDSHNGAVTLTNVDSSGNAGAGLVIGIPYSRTLTIKNSSFDDNDGNIFGSGLNISTLGVVVIDGLSASHNGSVEFRSPALLIRDSGAITIKNSIVNDNYGSGILNDVTPSKGPILLDNVIASNNHYFTDIEHEYGGYGIYLMANGGITAKNVIANDNMYSGLILDTCNSIEDPADSGIWKCTTTVTGNVSISNSTVNGNYSEYYGLLVDARGSITLENVQASGNIGYIRDDEDPGYGNLAHYYDGSLGG